MAIQEQAVVTAPNTSVISPRDPIIGICQVSTANTNRDGTGNLGTLVIGSTHGTRISLLRAVCTATSANGMIRIFLRDTTGRLALYDEMPITGTTPSATVETAKAEIVPTDEALILPYNWALLVATEKAETWNVFAFGGNL